MSGLSPSRNGYRRPYPNHRDDSGAFWLSDAYPFCLRVSRLYQRIRGTGQVILYLVYEKMNYLEEYGQNTYI
jgi:hypothetical protein